MSGFLARMAHASRERAAALPRAGWNAAAAPPTVPLTLSGFDLIAEIKPRSPAAGRLAPADADLAARARAYARGGAAAVSVLTEPSEFGGRLEHLQQVVAAVDGAVPVLRKDFLVDARQLEEARAAGASGVLLITALLDGHELPALLEHAAGLGLFVLLECFDETDLARAAALLALEPHRRRARAGELLLGVNARDLRTLAVEPGRLRALAPRLPRAAVAVAESGLEGPEDARDAARWGYRLALVGTALMRAADPGALIKAMLAAGRERAA